MTALIDDLLLCQGRRTVRPTTCIEDLHKEVPSTKKPITKREDSITGEHLDSRLEKTPLLWSQRLILLFLMGSFLGHTAICGNHLDVHHRSLLTYPALAIKPGSGPECDEGCRQADASSD